MTILIVNLWTGAPLVSLWLGSKLAGHDPWSMTAIVVVIAVLGVCAVATAIVVSRLTEVRDLIERRPGTEARPGWLRSMRAEGERDLHRRVGITALERAVIANVLVAVIVLMLWHFLLADAPSPILAPGL